MLHAELTGQVIGGCYQVHRELGHGFLESVYEAALGIVLREKGMQFEQQRDVTVRFHGFDIGVFRADLVVEDVVLVELKACRALRPEHEAQVLNYLRASSIEVGLLVNFSFELEFKRLIMTRPQ